MRRPLVSGMFGLGGDLNDDPGCHDDCDGPERWFSVQVSVGAIAWKIQV